MRTTAVGVMMVGLVASGLVVGDGSYPGSEGPGSINWPPPGGVSANPSFRNPAWNSAVGQGLRPYPEYQQAQRYRRPSTRQFRKELIAPPGDDWPNADYYRGKEQLAPGTPPGELRPEPMERGVPVEVVPPPSVPIDDVKAPISDKPERGWRPMKEQQDLEAMEESAVPPSGKEENRPLKMREVSRPVSPLHEPLEQPPQPPVTREEDSIQTPVPVHQQPVTSGMSIVPSDHGMQPPFAPRKIVSPSSE